MDTWEAIEELARGALRGEVRAARRLLNLAAPDLIVRAVRRRRLQWIERESLRIEAGQDCLCRVWERRKRYRGATVPEFYGWFNVICDTRAADVGRRLRHRREETVELSYEAEQALEALPEHSDPGLDFDVRDALEDCLQVLRREDADAYDVITLIYHVGMRIADIKNILVRPRSTVYQQRKRAHEALAECLEKRGVG